ncbi:MAG TPA: 3-oxoacyl-ACP synthase [Lentisphaeria bacterium]|nr:MAG: 3-oxoacyl-ACP synthase [Lentisphaerae bacterium GWF2_49_21]HBC87171.1 3-oxoacyl-ACP synthase [Lentisphaeria bacterium]
MFALGIEEIGSYIPHGRISNYSRKEKFGITDQFIEEKIGVQEVSIKEATEETSDLCVRAYQNLRIKIDLSPDDIEVVIVVTQNPDFNIPHVSAMLHGSLGFKSSCACFDISLGCSGYVYALSIIQSFMHANGLKKGLLFTADPYSKIIDKEDKNTSLLFGDGAAVTLISDKPLYTTGKFTFGTMGKDYDDLICRNKKLHMNGRSVFNFTAKVLPDDIHKVLKINGTEISKIDKFVFHQGSKFIVDTLTKRIGLPPEKVVFNAKSFGNTVSSSIPIILEKEIHEKQNRLMVISGFGVGLSWSSAVIKRA